MTDKRRIDPETGEVRRPTPEEQVLADAESIAQGAEEEVVDSPGLSEAAGASAGADCCCE